MIYVLYIFFGSLDPRFLQFKFAPCIFGHGCLFGDAYCSLEIPAEFFLPHCGTNVHLHTLDIYPQAFIHFATKYFFSFVQ